MCTQTPEETPVFHCGNSGRFLFTHESLCWVSFLEVIITDLLTERIFFSFFSSRREKFLLRRKKWRKENSSKWEMIWKASSPLGKYKRALRVRSDFWEIKEDLPMGKKAGNRV